MSHHPLVRAEWPDLPDIPPYDYAVATDDVHVGVYVRRVSGDEWHTLAGLVNHVVVAPNKRGNGLGREALELVLGWLEEVGVPYALLHATTESGSFYAHLGFHPVPNFPAPSHNGYRVSMVALVGKQFWPDGPVRYVEPW